eukprot:scaffold99603_cov17-Tisochrysis_lutea.AAC.1
MLAGPASNQADHIRNGVEHVGQEELHVEDDSLWRVCKQGAWCGTKLFWCMTNRLPDLGSCNLFQPNKYALMVWFAKIELSNGKARRGPGNQSSCLHASLYNGNVPVVAMDQGMFLTLHSTAATSVNAQKLSSRQHGGMMP